MIGAGQCVNWGVLYYAFPVFVLPVERELGVETWVVTGAFSLALLVSAAVAPTVGRWADRDHGALVMQVGGVMGSVLLVVWAAIPTVLSLYVVWLLLGLSMAATFYEPAFIVVSRVHRDPTSRLRALATVTLLGGLASSIFIPLTEMLVSHIGWQFTVITLAIVLLGSTYVTQFLVFRGATASWTASVADVSETPEKGVGRVGQFRFVAATFAATGMASAGFIANLVPALAERGVAPVTAAMLGGLGGLMQLPGRAFLLTGLLANSPKRLIAMCLAMQAAGLGIVSLSRATVAVAGGVMLLMAGAGLSTLVRPFLVQELFGAHQAGLVNGRLTRGQQLGRAVGPIMIAWLAHYIGYGVVLGLLGGVLVCFSVASYGILSD